MLLQDVLMQEAKLYLIFEFLTMDLKKYMDTNVPKDGQMDPKLVKSYTYQLLQVPWKRNMIPVLYFQKKCAQPLKIWIQLQLKDDSMNALDIYQLQWILSLKIQI